MEVKKTRDNQVIITDQNGLLYLDSVDNFEIDYGSPLEKPDGLWTEFQYNGTHLRQADGFTENVYVGSWKQGDDILANKDAILASQVARAEEGSY